MSQGLETPVAPFVDRRNSDVGGPPPACERRQFTNSHEGLSPEAGELAQAIDGYKLRHRRRFITYEEMLAVIKSLGYQK
jgi:NTP pyrophosphatase (non-canonical NTP hydrolase)